MSTKKPAPKPITPEPYRSEKYPDVDYPEAADYIDSVGLNPNDILLNGITDAGYYDRSGHNKVWLKWPSPEIGQKVLDLIYGAKS